MIIAILVLLASVTSFFTLLLPKLQEARERALRVPLVNNLKNLSGPIHTRPAVDKK
jgi:hypothetical protein